MYLSLVSVLVREYDEAIAFFTQKLGFELVEDTPLSATKRWVVVRPSGQSQGGILLARAVGEDQERCIGNQTGGGNGPLPVRGWLSRHAFSCRGPLAAL